MLNAYEYYHKNNDLIISKRINLVVGKEIYWEWESISDIVFDDFVFSSASTQQ